MKIILFLTFISRLRDDRVDLVDSKERLYGFDSHRMKDQAFLNGEYIIECCLTRM